MRKRKSQLLEIAADKLSDLSLPTLGSAKKSNRVRKPLTVLATLIGTGAVGVVAKTLLDDRYKTGESQCRGIYSYDSGEMTEAPGIIVSLYGVTFWAPAEMREAFEAAAKGNRLVPYRVDTWHRRKDGLLTGTFGASFLTGMTWSEFSQDRAKPEPAKA